MHTQYHAPCLTHRALTAASPGSTRRGVSAGTAVALSSVAPAPAPAPAPPSVPVTGHNSHKDTKNNSHKDTKLRTSPTRAASQSMQSSAYRKPRVQKDKTYTKVNTHTRKNTRSY